MKTFTKLILQMKVVAICTSLFLISHYAGAQCQGCGPELIYNGSFELGATGYTTNLIHNVSETITTGQHNHYAINTNADNANAGFDSVDAECDSVFMIVDGTTDSLNPLVWRQTVTGLIPGVQYIFSFYAIDIHFGYPVSNSPELLARIDGIVQVPTTGQLSNVWTQYCYPFTASALGVAVLAIEQVNFEGDGNDYGVDCISLKQHCDCEKCICRIDGNLGHFAIDADGVATVDLNLSGSPFAPTDKFRITLVNYHSLVNDECRKCDVTEEESFGTITGAPNLYGEDPLYAPFNSQFGLPTPPYSREVTWCYDPGVLFPSTVVHLDLKFPPVYNLDCCKNNVSFCLRIEFWGKECKACDHLICFDGIGQNPEPKSLITTPEQKVKTPPVKSQGSLKVIPNPASNNFKIVIDKENLGGTLQIFDLNGSLIKEAVVASEDYTVNTKSYAEGMYLIKYQSSKGAFQQKVVIKK